MERTLVLIKPDAMQRNLAGTIIARLEKLGMKLVALKILHPDKALAQRHYAVHKDKPFYNDLVDYISSAPIVACVFEGEGAVEKIRKGTIRGDFGESLERNSVHGSDSPGNAEIEIELFFSPDELFGY
jgi:nucleoside-diphosphate kinase